MLVFYKERLVLLSVPKTGTTAYQAALAPFADMVISDPPDLKHAPLYRYNRFFRKMFEKVCNVDMETIAVMREPISWLGSWYRYRKRPFMSGKPNSTEHISFDDFVSAYAKGDRPGYANVGSQAKFLEARPNGTNITHLFRYEDSAALDSFLKTRLGVDFTLELRNVSPRQDLSLRPETIAKLRAKCGAEFDLYDNIPVR
ncbi:MAG: gamma-glutamyl kinase [Sedimentitalea sp.]